MMFRPVSVFSCLWQLAACALLSVASACSSKENTALVTLGHVQFDVSVEERDASANSPISLTVTSADGKYSHTWADWHEFSALEGLYSGRYIAKAVLGEEGAEGYDCPCYIGEKEFVVAENALTSVHLDCTLSQARIRLICSDDLIAHFPRCYAIAHARGASYVDVSPNVSSSAYITPGATDLSLHLDDGNGGSVNISTGLSLSTMAGELYQVRAEYDGSGISLQCSDKLVTVNITDDIFDTPVPSIVCQGFSDARPVTLTEGFPASSSLVMVVESGSDLQSLLLTVVSDGAVIDELPSQVDLMDYAQQLTSRGLKIDKVDARHISVDFTDLVESIAVSADSELSFLLQAQDRLGRVSDVASLYLLIRVVDAELVSYSPAEIGVNRASVTLALNEPSVEVSDFTVYVDDGINAAGPLDLLPTSAADGVGTVTLDFAVPEGVASVPVRIDYMDKPKLSLSVERSVPQYDIVVDAFATSMFVDIKCPSQAVTVALTKYAHLFVGGKEVAILSRNEEKGELYCAGFSPVTSYDVSVVVIDGQYAPVQKVRTEAATKIPDGDFEDVSPLYEYNKFPSGGIYSSTSFPIYNQQNFVDVNVYWPKKSWASINAKTFCLQSECRNTWYMQPSAQIDFDNFASGSKSIRISSVGWSLNGKEIEPYVQPIDNVTPYNMHIPPIDNISPGLLFLGSYTFDASTQSEVYISSVKFGSRPSSLNGFFKYQPDEGNPTDCGWGLVEILNIDASGHETLLARSRIEFSIAPDFRSFYMPLDYEVFFVPATHVRVMFCSSVASTAPAYSDTNVPVSVDIPNARFIGSLLWIDNLSFSY